MNDHKCYIFFAGYHSVAFASDILTRFRIENRIVKAPVNMRGSCSFAVMIDESDLDMCMLVLKNNKIAIECIYK